MCVCQVLSAKLTGRDTFKITVVTVDALGRRCRPLTLLLRALAPYTRIRAVLVSFLRSGVLSSEEEISTYNLAYGC